MTRLAVQLLRAEPSSANEYEGVVVVGVDGVELWCETVLSGADEWAALSVGATLDAELLLERRGPIEPAAAEARSGLRHVDGSLYEVGAVVVEVVDADRVVLDTTPPLPLDVERSPHADPPVPELAAGDAIRLEAVLQIDLDPD